MSSYLHCNSCFVQYNNAAPLLILNCKHVLCNSCFASGYCPIHKKPAKSIVINKDMPQSVSFLFQNTMEKMEEAMTAEAFQLDQKLSLFMHNASLKVKHEEMKNSIADYEKNIQLKEAAYENELVTIKQLRKSIEKVRNTSNEKIPSQLLNISSTSSHSTVSTPSFLSMSPNSSGARPMDCSFGKEDSKTRSEVFAFNKQGAQGQGGSKTATMEKRGPFQYSESRPDNHPGSQSGNRSIFSQNLSRSGPNYPNKR